MPANARHSHGVRRALLALGCAAAMFAAPAPTAAQQVAFQPPVQFEARLDLLGGPPAGVQVAAGANVAADYYLRIGADVAAGVAARGGAAVASGRVDVAARYLLDPFHEFRWGPYAGGGFTTQWNRVAGWRGDLLLLVGVEGPAHRGWRTSVELGLGGGARLGVVFRRARSNGR
jgi:hypothetical protein